MHGTVYQIGKEPVKEEDRITDKDLPDWFWSKMDYAETVDDEYGMERAETTGSRPGLAFDPATRRLTVENTETYFKVKFDVFRELAGEMSKWTLDKFMHGGAIDKVTLDDAYDDGYDIYIYTEENGLETLDSYIRYGGQGGYVGAVIDYHY